MTRFLYLTLRTVLAAGLCGLASRAIALGEEESPPKATAVPFSISTADSVTAPELGAMPTPGTIQHPLTNVSEEDQLKQYQTQLELGREQRRQKSGDMAQATLSELLKSDAPNEIKRLALFELALVAQDQEKFVRAEQIFGQYLQVYPDDPSVPEVLLRQGLIYRQMGVNSMAVSKFYAVMSSALKLRLDNMDYYKKIVLQAEIEVADTYYQEGHYEEAVEYFNRLLKARDPELDRAQTQFKLVHALTHMSNYDETVAQAQNYLKLYTNGADVAEVRFSLASAQEKLGHNNDAMKQVLILLQSQQDNVKKNPEAWVYWQRRAGNEIADQLFKEGDYFNALQIYLALADLDKSAAWQMPVWYQTALVYEQLQQWAKAIEQYDRILARQKELTGDAATPALASLGEMAKWREDYIQWLQKARLTQQTFVLTKNTNSTSSTTP